MAVVSYNKGDTVVINVYGKRQVGIVADKAKTVKGYRYYINSEDGKEHEGVYVDTNDVTVFIDSRLTKSFTKHQTATNKLMDDAIDIVNNN